MTSQPRIALIHATPISMEPIRWAFEAGWPGAETVNILEDSLAVDRAKTADLTSDMVRRVEALA
ncbi:MAG: arylsulfatase, partial [Mesorhizobium sp.]